MTNVVVLHGNFTRDPEVKEISSNGRDTAVANFSLAANRYYTTADGTKEKEVTYVDCEAWDSGAKTIGKFCSKGDPLLIQGSLKLDQWEDKDGNKRSKLKVRVDKFTLLNRGAKPEEDSSPEQDEVASDQNEEVLEGAGEGEEIPF